MSEALPLFYRAIELDPEFASAYGMAAWCVFWRKVNGWMIDPQQEIAEGTRLASQAVELGKNDAVALTRGGHALSNFTDDIMGGVAFVERAQVLDPNLAAGWFLSAYLRLWRGDPDDAIERFAHAMRLSPLDSEMYRMQAGTAMAHLFAGRVEDALSWAEKAFGELPSFAIVSGVIASAHGLAGRTDQAHRAMDRLRQLYPALRLSNLRDWLPIQRPVDLATFAEGLRKAGLPE